MIFAVFLMSEAWLSREFVKRVYEQLWDFLKNNNQYLDLFILNTEKFNTANNEQRKFLFIIVAPLLRKDVYRNAKETLGKIGDIEHFPLLEPLFRDNDSWVRRASAEAWGNIVTAKNISLLEPLIRGEYWDVRCTAAEMLGKIGSTQDIPLLESLLRDENEHVRQDAARALGEIGTSKDIPLLVPLLRDKKYWTYYAAVNALWKLVSKKDIPLLEPLLSDESKYVRHASVNVLGNIGTAKDIPLLEPLLMDIDKDVRHASVNALGKIGTSEHIPLLEPLLRDIEKDVRRAIVAALGKIGLSKYIPLLVPLLSDKEWEVRLATFEAIENIYRRSAPVLHINRVLTSEKEKKAISVKTFSGQPLHILHISDIHYALEKDPTITCIFHEFLRDIQKWRAQQKNEKIQSICLTGDIAQSGKKNQYESINEKINAILNTTGCSKEHLFIIPGNHDVHEYEDISDKGKTTIEEVRDNKMNIDTGVLSKFENYREFHEKFKHYYRFVENSGYLNSLPLTGKRSGSPKPWYSRKLQDFPVRIIGLNSALFCLKEFSEYGKIRMGTNQFHEAYFQGKLGSIPKDELVILLTHHPVNWLAENEYEDYTTLMERYGIIHLHGHIHRTKIRKLFSIAGSSYISVGTGSLYGEKGLGDINTYHIITLDFKKEEVHIWARRWIPERGSWGVYDNDINNTFPFPGKHH